MSRCLALLLALVWAGIAAAQDLSGLARIDAAQSRLSESWRGDVTLRLSLSQGVPWRLFHLDDPRRLVLDFREVDWRGFDPDILGRAEAVGAIRVGGFRPGWSRMVLDLNAPMLVEEAGLALDDVTGRARLSLRLSRADAGDFAATSGAPRDPRWDLPEPAATAPPENARSDWAPTVVVLDPGHGGIDPGAQRDGVTEKHLMLTFARELRDTLRRTGDFEVIMTRDEDVFVSLEGRVALAHRAGADVFISLHADTISEGHATGATVYTLSNDASDEASAQLAARHDRADILAGLDLSGTDDRITGVLLDLARLETGPRTDSLANLVVRGMRGAAGAINRHPRRHAAFSVLKAADIPSILVEVGFLSSQEDRERLTDPNWRAAMAAGIRDGLQRWVDEDRATRRLMRR